MPDRLPTDSIRVGGWQDVGFIKGGDIFVKGGRGTGLTSYVPTTLNRSTLSSIYRFDSTQARRPLTTTNTHTHTQHKSALLLLVLLLLLLRDAVRPRTRLHLNNRYFMYIYIYMYTHYTK
jgi:hypothetical protein